MRLHVCVRERVRERELKPTLHVLKCMYNIFNGIFSYHIVMVSIHLHSNIFVTLTKAVIPHLTDLFLNLHGGIKKIILTKNQTFHSVTLVFTYHGQAHELVC
jgi:hypothetical protein